MTRLLLAENDATLAKILGYKFELKGFSVTIAPDGRAAWEKAQQTVFDLVITDNAMAEMNGDDLCRHLRDDCRYVQTPIIMITAFVGCSPCEALIMRRFLLRWAEVSRKVVDRLGNGSSDMRCRSTTRSCSAGSCVGSTSSWLPHDSNASPSFSAVE
ncbi:MAG: response regulator [Planctomycetes bacterium]|nr:response regulator [Planctomycetota bacterium]